MTSNDWKEVQLKDVILFNPRESIKKGTMAKKISMDKLAPYQKKITGFEYAEFKSGTKFKNGDTLLARITPCLENGKTAQVDILDDNEIGFGSTEFIVMREISGISDNDFIYYLAISDDFRNIAIKSMTGTSGRQRVQMDVLEQTKLLIPPLREQKAIANILSTLDEKIETNNQINEKLEEMAQALFKHWFVDFEFPNENGEPYKSSGGEMVESELGMIPKGWRVVKLKEIIEFIKNSTKPGEQLNNRKYVPIDTMPIKKLILNSYKSYKEAKSSLILFEKYDILIGAMRVYFHRVNLAPFRGVTRTTTFVLRSKSLEDISYNLLLLNMPSTISYADQSSIGSTIPYAVWEGGLGEMLLAQPPIEIRKKFNNVIFPLLEKMILNSQQNIRIQKIRDTLLPKLMSGEIRVPVEEEK